MAEPILDIRTMRRADLDLAIEWAAREGWNPGIRDAACFFAADPEGFLLASLDDEPVAVISAVRYGEEFGFVGFYIVAPAFRGQGFGLRIWQAAMERLAGRNVGIDGVVAQQENYLKSGFRLAYRNIRYAGRQGPGGSGDEAGIIPLTEIPFETLAAYDRRHFPAPREDFLRTWIAQPGGAARGAWDGARLRGYGVIRPCRQGHKIGPLFADDPEVGERLFQALTRSVGEGELFYLDIPETNPDAVDLVCRHAMEMVFETARMYTGECPRLPISSMFGVTSFELG